MALASYGSRGFTYTPCMLFEIRNTVWYLYLRFLRRLLLKALSADERVFVKISMDEKINPFKRIIMQNYSALQEVYAMADECRIGLEQTGDTIIQKMFYNGWIHDDYVANIFVFAKIGGLYTASPMHLEASPICLLQTGTVFTTSHSICLPRQVHKWS